MFRYWLPAGSTDSLTMHVLRRGQLSDVLWKQSGVVSSSWEVAEVTVSSPVEFKVTKLSDWRLWQKTRRVFLAIPVNLLSLTRWCCRPSTVRTATLRWKSTMFLWGTEPAILQGAVTLSLDSVTGSTSTRKMDTTGCWPMEASGVQKKTTPLKPQRVDMLLYLHENINMQKKNPTNNNK